MKEDERALGGELMEPVPVAPLPAAMSAAVTRFMGQPLRWTSVRPRGVYSLPMSAPLAAGRSSKPMVRMIGPAAAAKREWSKYGVIWAVAGAGAIPAR